MLFSKRKQPAHQCEISYDDVVTYLRDLEQADHTKILKVVSTYREADKKVKKILNIKDEPIDLDDDIGDLLLEDELPLKTETPKKAKKNASR